MRLGWLVLAAVALLPLGAAEECVPIGAAPDVAFSGFYLEQDACPPGCAASVWIYQESNGMAGLQRSDAVADHTCGGALAPDTLVAGSRR